MNAAEIVTILVSVFGSGGAAWAGVKASLNGTRARVERIEDKLDKVIEDRADDSKKIAVLYERTRHLENP